MAETADDFDFIYHNIIFPPKLPQAADEYDELSKQQVLALFVARSISNYAILQSQGGTRLWTQLTRTLEWLLKSYICGFVVENELQDAFRSMEIGDMLALPIRCQNAALNVSRDARGFVVECYEVSPQNEVVMSAARLHMTFPAQSIMIPPDIFLEQNFQDEFCKFLNKLNAMAVDGMLPRTQKAGTSVVETRDSANPHMVTQLLIAILATEGSHVQMQTITKNVRDNVCYVSSRLPWRRCPLWLVIRVSLHLTFARTGQPQTGRIWYKDFMCHVFSNLLEDALERESTSERLHLINLKLGRRTAKLGSCLSTATTVVIIERLERSRLLIQQRWGLVQEQHHLTLDLTPDDEPEDSQLELSNSGEYVRSRIQNARNAHIPGPLDSFNVDSWTRPKLFPNLLPDWRTIAQASTPKLYGLFDLESWVASCLQSWSENSPLYASTCTDLCDLIQRYYLAAKDCYKGDAKQLSLMYLTIFELWCTLDQAAIKLCPMIRQSNPELPLTILQPLLLSDRKAFKRLARVEAYIKSRQGTVSVFGLIGPNSFSVQYYDRCTEMRALKASIENDARQAESLKRDEWRRLGAQYDSLMGQAAALIHDHGRYSVACDKCMIERRAKSLSVQKYEWPLPASMYHAKAAVFELKCPSAFRAWREITWMLLYDLRPRQLENRHSVEERLSTYDALWRYNSYAVGQSRVTMASTTKSFMRSHYDTRDFPCEFRDVSLPNALKFELFDQNDFVLTANVVRIPTIKAHCTLRVQEAPYSVVQWALESYTHTENQVIAAQNSCPLELNLHEFYAFAALRSGERLQWVNILRELASSDLQWNSMSVRILIEQTVWEAGSSETEDDFRAAWVLCKSTAITWKLLKAIERKLGSVEENWNQIHCMEALVTIMTQVCNLLQDHTAQIKAREILLKMRITLMQWVDDLLSHLQELKDYNAIRQCQDRLCYTCICCHTTYGILRALNSSEVFPDTEAVATFVRCSVIIQDHLPTALPVNLQHLRRRDERLTLELLTALQELVFSCPTGFNEGIRKIWSDADITSPWTFVDSDKLWVKNSTSVDKHHESQSVHYNLFDGTLLINGRRVGRLPESMTKHPAYQELFGSRIVEVIPSNIRGFSYQAARQIQGNTVHFGSLKEDLIVRAVRAGEHLELIDRKYFRGDLPNTLIMNYVHWLDVGSAQVYFRPRKLPWDPSPNQWQMSCTASSFSVKLEDRFLLNSNRPFARYLISIFEALDCQDHILISRPENAPVEIELTRLRLHFFVRPDRHIQSRELQALVDTDQNLGALIGLKNRLILCGESQKTGNLFRRVIVPFGEVHATRDGEHVKVSVAAPGQASVYYVTFAVDETLKCLRSPAEPRTRLFQALLQAVCSGVLADPLTNRTGVEEALCCLQEAAVFRSKPLEKDSLGLLRKIAQISPRRNFYPKHLQVMETAAWRDDLLTTVQTDEFTFAVRDILGHNGKFRAFHGYGDTIDLEEESKFCLSQRAVYQTTSASSKLLGPFVRDTKRDRLFRARDRTSRANLYHQSQATFEIATLIKTWGKGNSVLMDLHDYFLRWGTVSGFGENFCLLDLNELSVIPIQEHWGALYEICRTSTGRHNRWKLSFLFGVLAFGQPALLPHFRTLLEFAFRAVNPGFSTIPKGEYRVHNGHRPLLVKLQSVIGSYLVAFRNISRNESYTSYHELKERHGERTQKHRDDLVAFAVQSWDSRPGSDLASPSFLDPSLVRIDVMKSLGQLFRELFRNLQLYQAALRVQEVFKSRFDGKTRSKIDDSLPDFTIPDTHNEAHPQSRNLDLSHLMKSRSCYLPLEIVPAVREDVKQTVAGNGCDELENLINIHAQRGGKIRRTYAQNLKTSATALQAPAEQSVSENFAPIAELDWDMRQHKQALDVMFDLISDTLSPKNKIETAVFLTGLWPQIDIRSILREISPERHGRIEKVWRSCIIHFGRAITMYQRSVRLLEYAEAHNQVSYRKELANLGYDGWSPEQYPEWLLMQVEHNFLIRRVQVDVAKHMISPKDYKSAVMQLNMGEGKSSVIIPMVAAVLANERCLVRIVVLKPLFTQMIGVLSERLGGLVGRRIMSVPFNRQTPLSSTRLAELKAMYQSWKDRGDIFLVQPEHILSFKLMSLDRLFNGQLSFANQMLDLHAWTGRHCRDLLDESDELLSPNFELVYTIGTQRLVSGQPDRWTLAQRVLSLIGRNIGDAHQRHPSAVEVDSNTPGAFPSIRISDATANSYLMTQVVRDISAGFVPEISLEHCSTYARKALLNFIENRELSTDIQQTVLEYHGESTTLNSLLVLRGLIGYGITFFALHQKRWTVNYGLDRGRCLMAVPYRAKGVPSVSAEFGHPDCAIVLTCLSFYYEGLTEQQLLQCFHLLLCMADPSVEYELWQKPLDLPPGLRRVKGVNMDDSKQWTETIFPKFRRNKATVDFFLTNVVFPREAKEFDFKLSTSGWDLASECTLTTGFSGTNDLCLLNPLSIRQLDIQKLLKTSALVLQNLLSRENREVISIEGDHSKKMGSTDLIELVARQTPKVQVVIDVGAQVLELTNREVIKLWLEIDPNAVAGVYFDESDTPMVSDRSGTSERLIISGYRGNLNDCVVFLDEAHTRGIDLDLPSNFKAMVTLGPSLMKDRFVQACMRMRKLALGQSIVTFAPFEIRMSILKLLGKNSRDKIDVSHVVSWLLEQTCLQIEKFYPLWLSKGMSHTRRRLAYDSALSASNNDINAMVNQNSIVTDLMEATREREARSLEELYLNQPDHHLLDHTIEASSDLVAQKLVAEYNSVGDYSLMRDSSIHEEQEREIQFEGEAEREVERPPKVNPLTPSVHIDVKSLVRYGKVPAGALYRSFHPAFSVFDGTTAKWLLPQNRIADSMLVTGDFMRAVELPRSGTTDDYLRPVRWVLTSTQTNTMFILSQHEANELLPNIRKSEIVTLRIYAPRVTRQMDSFYNLERYHVNSPSLIPGNSSADNLTSLHLFAGALYFDAHLHYRQMCNFLGVVGGGNSIKSGAKVESDGFVKPKDREGEGWGVNRFSQNPLPLVKAILGMRRKGENYTSTHMGRIVAARGMNKEEFE